MLRPSSYLGATLLFAVSVTTACEQRLEGPSPAVDPPSAAAATPPIDPGIICRDQRVSEVVVTGTGFSPVPIDVPNSPRTAIPTVTLTRALGLDGSPGDGAEVVYNGDPDVPENVSLLSWQSQQQMTFEVVPPCAGDADCGDGYVCHPTASVCAPTADATLSGRLEEGVYDVSVRNANTNSATSSGALAVIEKPTLSTLGPPIVCLAQGERSVTMTGTRFLTINSAEANVSIEGVATPFAVDAGTFDQCTDIPHEGFNTLRYCSEGTITLPQDSVAVGYPAVNVNNPETAACVTEDVVNLRVVPPPTINAVAEVGEDQDAVVTGDGTIVCATEGPRDVVIHGTDFLEIDGALPAVTLDGTAITSKSIAGCEDLPTMDLTVRKCTRLTVEVPQAMAATTDPYQPVIQMTNPEPAGCNDTTTDRLNLLTIAPPPDVQSVEPPLVCIDDGDREVTVEGVDFLTIDGAVPDVAFINADGSSVPPVSVTAQSCVALDVGGKTVERCDELLVVIAQNSVALGQPDVSVTNPMPAGCNDTESGLLTIIEGPEITSAAPPLVCTDESDRTIVITGSGFVDVDGAWPTVTMDGVAVTVDALSGCVNVPVNGLTVQQCDTITVTAPQGALTEGDTEVVVTNPPPAGCAVSNTVVVTVPPPVTITAVDPIGVCVGIAATETLTISGTGFLTIDGTPFEVTVDGSPVTPDSVSDCVNLDVDGLTVESCNTIVVTYDFTGMAAGPVPIGVSNPSPSDCGTIATDVFQLSPPPTVNSVQPPELCSDVVNDALTIIGTDFATNASVTLTGSTVGDVQPSTVNVVSDTQIDLTFADGLPADTYDITVSNGTSCDSTLTAGLTVHPTPLVFFVDPPVVYNGITTEVTVYATGLDQLVAAVELIADDGTVTALTTFSNPDPAKPNRIGAEVPSGLASGTYEVSVTSAYDCASSLNGTLVVTDTLTLDLAGIDPAFASPTNDTAVTVTSTDPAPSGFVNFVPVPRVYLNPTSDPTATATALKATLLEDQFTLNGIVPGGLTPGDYDLIAVNPSGEVGLIAAGVTVTAAEPPFITALAPASLDSNTAGQLVSVVGDNFTTDAAGTTVSLECRDFVSGALVTAPTVSVTGADVNQVDVSVDTSGVPAGSVCVVSLTNPDGASYNFSALSVKEPSQNLNPWSAGPTMLEARRGLSVVAGRPTDRSRFLYAIGGDDGALANAKTSVESNPIGIFGGMAPTWTYQRNDLSTVWDTSATATASMPRTFAEAVRVENFVYLVGGDDGTGSQASVLRAQVLQPQDAPEIASLDAALGDGVTGIGAGIWYYRVAAVFPDTDAHNPGGESLPGEVQTVQLPDIPELLVLTLNWEATPGASGYRVYRTPVADDVPTHLQLIGETVGNDATSLVENGLTADPAEVPFEQGSLGVWHTAGSLGTARSAHASVVVRNPANPSEYWVYAAGGRDASGSVTDSVEFTTITVDPSTGSQTVGSWASTTATLGAARAELGGFVVTAADTSLVAVDEPIVYFSQGSTDTNTSNLFEAALVGTDGDLAALSDIGGPTPVRVGATDLQANGWLFLLGGSNGNASNGNDTSGEVVAPAPSIDNWDALGGGSMLESRIFTGSSAESAFFFILGGSDGTDALDTIEQTIQ